MAKNERRIQERFSLKLQVKFSGESDLAQGKVKEETIAANISSGGAFLSTKQKLPLASKVYLEFLVDLEELKKLRFILSLDSLKASVGKKIWVKATGIVIRSEDDGLGIIFDENYQLSPMDASDKD